MPAERVSIAAYVRLLRSNANFRRLLLAQMVSEIGDWLYSVSIYSLLLELTGSARYVAMAVVLQVLPQALIAPMAGVVNDRMSRRRVMIYADLARAGIVLGMLAVQSRELVWMLYVLLLLQTFMWGFFEPGRSAVIPNLLKNKDEIVVANALSSTAWSFNLAFGSTMGGIVAVLFGRRSVFVVNAISFLVSALVLRGMRFEEPHTHGSRPLQLKDLADFSPVLEGLRYVWSDARMLAILMAKAGLGFIGAHWVLLPIFGERIFPVSWGQMDAQRAGMMGMSLLMGARGVGALIGPLASGYWAGGQPDRLRRGITHGFLAVALGYGLLSIAPNAWMAAATVIVAHAGASTVWVFSTTLLHKMTGDRFRGRVFAADFSFMVLGMALTTYAAGVAVDLGVSVRLISLVMGAMALLPSSIWAWKALPLWRGVEGESDSNRLDS